MSTIEEHNALTVTEIRARIEKPDEYIFPENAAADAATLLALLEYTESKAHYAQLFARVELERTKATLAVEVRHATKLEEHIAPVLEDLIAFCDGGACVGLLADARHALALLTRVSELPPPELLEEPEQDKPATNMLAALPFHGYLGQRYTGTPEQEDERAEVAAACAAWLFRQGFSVYSPIAAWHHIQRAHNISSVDAQNFEMLSRHGVASCRELWILMFDDWRKSEGLVLECRDADKQGKTTRFIEYDGRDAATRTPMFSWGSTPPERDHEERGRK